MTKFDNGFILSTDELKELLEKAFSNGALSHAKWDGQRDTCWSNVNEDMKDEVSEILSDLNSKVVIFETLKIIAMNKKEQILKILWGNQHEIGFGNRAIGTDSFENVAEDIVKFIPDVVGRSERCNNMR